MMRVVKVGGSLLDLPDLATRLEAWLTQQPIACNVLLMGGGILCDAVREWDSRFQLGEVASHWLCIDLLDTTAKLLGQLLPHARIVTDRRALPREPGTCIFSPGTFLRHEEPRLPGTRLPPSWQVTADSIAARLAEVIGAEELVLLKSTESSETEFVDSHFSIASRNIAAVRFVNLREH